MVSSRTFVLSGSRGQRSSSRVLTCSQPDAPTLATPLSRLASVAQVEKLGEIRKFFQLCYRFRDRAAIEVGGGRVEGGPRSRSPALGRPLLVGRPLRRFRLGVFPRADEVQPQIVLRLLERGVGIEAESKIESDPIQCTVERKLF